VPVRKPHDAGLQAGIAELSRQFRSGTLAGRIRVGIKGNENLPAVVVRELGELIGREVASER
jgi:hypothetical protein